MASHGLTVLPPTTRAGEYLLPAQYLLYSLAYLPSTIYHTLTGPAPFTDTFFSRIWASLPVDFSEEKRRIIAGAHGVVIEIGPGLGNTLQWYDKDKVDSLYLVEPNRAMHTELKEAVVKYGWEGRCKVVACGIEDAQELAKEGVPKEGVDCLVSIQVLCSIPDPSIHLPALHRRLKRGGELRIFEHIRSHDSTTAWLQWFYDFVWHIPFAGCELSRPTDKLLGELEGWKEVQLEKIKGESRWCTIPSSWGWLVKA
ncbi:S-adenosyl-L-methionine-dependent methyltransferase [Tricharina praecox]|uniref:S-adenosyl-L-methionine-dependent methyltransferase n=1 Tax=Tricharina praecox TaxID=43433 RepID=UPI002220BF71|nr:S-adenosyl-L-methionine-dependent methyltransferase [Tricharina praecox]KAI5855999.1 S-adenosyl-L-methionine-dependent methyltransferase [Tricharina praecox]